MFHQSGASICNNALDCRATVVVYVSIPTHRKTSSSGAAPRRYHAKCLKHIHVPTHAIRMSLHAFASAFLMGLQVCLCEFEKSQQQPGSGRQKAVSMFVTGLGGFAGLVVVGGGVTGRYNESS